MSSTGCSGSTARIAPDHRARSGCAAPPWCAPPASSRCSRTAPPAHRSRFRIRSRSHRASPIFTSRTTPTISAGSLVIIVSVMCLPIGSWPGKELLRGVLADDDHARPAEAVGLGEVAAGEHLDARGLEVARRRQAHRHHRHLGFLHRRLAFDGDVLGRAALQRQAVDPRRRLHAGQRAHVGERAIEELVARAPASCISPREYRPSRSGRCSSRSPGSTDAQAAQAAHQQAGADQQHQRERHFRHHQQVADAAVAARRIAAAGTGLERIVRIAAGQLPRRHERREQARRQARSRS